MNQILKWLSSGDLRGDGIADQVVEMVLQDPQLLNDLIEGLQHEDDVIRGHSADALEKLARQIPVDVLPYMPLLLDAARHDSLSMVQMHLAMLLGHMAYDPAYTEQIVDALYTLLGSGSAFARSWAVSSLCIVARLYPQHLAPVTKRIAGLQNDESIAIRTRVRYALDLLTNPSAPFPKGWVKSETIRKRLYE